MLEERLQCSGMRGMMPRFPVLAAARKLLSSLGVLRMDVVSAFARVLQVERLELNLFRGVNADVGRDQLYGGQVLGQALMAASLTVEGRRAHSLHAYFLRAGDIHQPVVYEVDRIRDGGSFSSRRVVAIQNGKAILHCGLSFQREEAGADHQATMPKVPSPEEVGEDPAAVDRILDRLNKRMREAYLRSNPFEAREVYPDLSAGDDGLKRHCIWVRTRRPLEGNDQLQQAALTYMSDFNLLQTSLLPHQLKLGQHDMQVASLDHSMWFHQPVIVDDWLLYVTDSPRAVNARGFCRGMLFDRQGRLVASVAQEGLIRQLKMAG